MAFKFKFLKNINLNFQWCAHKPV